MSYRKFKYNRKKGNFKAFISIVVLFLVLIYGFIYIDKKIKPTVLAIAEVNASVSLSPLLKLVCVMELIGN